MNTGEIRLRALERFEEVARYLYPMGRKDGCRWLLGSANGEPGKSFSINLKTGIFGDFADGKKMKSGGIDLWMVARDVDFKTALAGLAAWLGIPNHGGFQTEQSAPKRLVMRKRILLPELVKPTENDIRLISESRSIDAAPLQIAAGRGLWFCFDDELNGRCWVITDEMRRCAIRRRIDNQLFRLKNGKQTKAAACPGSDMSSAIGYHEAQPFPCIGIVEGGPNAIAVIAHARASGVNAWVAPICMPSTNANFTEATLAYLQGKRGRVFIDNDRPGIEAANRWAAQLQTADVVIDGFSFDGLIQNDGSAVKDLNDLLRVDADCWEANREVIESVMSFTFGGRTSWRG
jgi:hypothetical protein